MPALSTWWLYRLRAVCTAAADSARGRAGIFTEGGFTDFDFQKALRLDLDSVHRPGMRACRELLDRLPFIDRGQGELRGVFTWRKSNAPLPAWNVPRYDTEFLLWFGRGPNPVNIRLLRSMVFDCPFPPAGCFASERFVDATKRAIHPAQKPLKLMRQVVEAFTKPGDVVLDCFMGTATTGVVCVESGRDFIGVEREQDFSRIARRRIRAAVKAKSQAVA